MNDINSSDEHMPEETRLTVNGQLRLALSEYEDIIETLIAKAKSGDSDAAKLILDRTVSTLKPVTQCTSVLGINSKTDLHGWYQSVIQAVIHGEISIEQAQSLLSLVKDRYQHIAEDISSFVDVCEAMPMVEEPKAH